MRRSDLPDAAALVAESPLSIFEDIATRLQSSPARRTYPLHQGKTAFTAPVSVREWGASEFEYPSHHDGPVAGAGSLLTAIADKLSRRLGEADYRYRVQVTSGITHALHIAFRSILRPGDEVIICSPYWLFAPGVVRAAGGVPVEVPFFPCAGEDWPNPPREQVFSVVNDRTRAIYFNTPNNPTGRSVPAGDLRELVDAALERDLWVISDNAYEDYDYSSDGFVDIASFPAARDRVFAAYSFSKSFGMTGYRIGYLLAPPVMAEMARKFALYSVYSPPTVSQYMALSALRLGNEVLRAHRTFIEEAMGLAMTGMKPPATTPDGGFYTFLDLSAWQGGADRFIARCLDRGVSLAPGRCFGSAYRNHARLCFGVVSHDDLSVAIEILNDVYDQG